MSRRPKFPTCRTDERLEKTRRVVEKRQPTLTLVMENINDPHNLSAVLRSCDAVGVYEVSLIYYGTQQMPKLGEKSSASAYKWVELNMYGSVEECYAKLRKEGKKIYSTHMAKDAVSLYDLDLTGPVALVFGNEHTGVSEEAAEQADGNFLIPQVGMIQRLNISVAAAVSLFEAFRQRQSKGMYDKIQFDEENFDSILKEWLSK